MPKLSVDPSVCIGCGLCTQLAPSLFVLGDDGIAKELVSKITDTGAASEAKEACPAAAISIE